MTREEIARDSFGSWSLAIAALRECGVRSGQYEPRNDIERRQANQGPRPPHELDVVSPSQYCGGEVGR